MKNAINILLEFITEKDSSDNSIKLSQFKSSFFSKYNYELLSSEIR